MIARRRPPLPSHFIGLRHVPLTASRLKGYTKYRRIQKGARNGNIWPPPGQKDRRKPSGPLGSADLPAQQTPVRY
jgi:hypothetical protein